MEQSIRKTKIKKTGTHNIGELKRTSHGTIGKT